MLIFIDCKRLCAFILVKKNLIGESEKMVFLLQKRRCHLILRIILHIAEFFGSLKSKVILLKKNVNKLCIRWIKYIIEMCQEVSGIISQIRVAELPSCNPTITIPLQMYCWCRGTNHGKWKMWQHLTNCMDA